MSVLNNRSAKKPRHNSSVISIGSSEVRNFCNSSASVLNIIENESVKNIINCHELSIIRLEDTKVRKLKACSILYSLAIVNNQGIVKLNLPSVREMDLRGLDDIEIIEMPFVRTVILENLPSVHDIKLPVAIDITISNIGRNFCPLLIQSFPAANSINVSNIKYFHYAERFSSKNLKNLCINNCDIERLCNLNDFTELIIENCNSLRSIENIKNVRSLKIVNCPNLIKVKNISSNGLSISRCNKLFKVAHITSNNLIIEYCFDLTILPVLRVCNMNITRCPSIVKIHLFEDLSTITIDNCEDLSCLEFNCNEAFCYSNLIITMNGNNQITEIKDWYVAKLNIKDNSTLESIKSIYNLLDLVLINCSDLYALSEISVLENLLIESCCALEHVVNVYGFSNLVLIHCDSLCVFEMYLTELITVTIQNCKNLNITMSGDLLESLSLVECGSVIISDLAECNLIEIKNVGLMPDISSKHRLQRNNNYYPETLIIRNHFNKLSRNATSIINTVRAYIIRKKFVQYMQMSRNNELYDCVICQEPISFETLRITQCKHMFHAGCLFEWISVRNKCPLCNELV